MVVNKKRVFTENNQLPVKTVFEEQTQEQAAAEMNKLPENLIVDPSKNIMANTNTALSDIIKANGGITPYELDPEMTEEAFTIMTPEEQMLWYKEASIKKQQLDSAAPNDGVNFYSPSN